MDFGENDMVTVPDAFRRLLFARVPEEDLEAYDEASLAKAAELAYRLVTAHGPGASDIEVVSGSTVRCHGRPVTVITVVNDNMPFLFDSLIGEITAVAGEPTLVVHPIFRWRDGKVDGLAAPGPAPEGEKRISVVHVHCRPLAAAQIRQLEEGLALVCRQVRAAVAGWKPMLARLAEAIEQYRRLPPPLDPARVAEAIAFLEWLAADNFTFLGMREFALAGPVAEGRLAVVEARSLGILSDPNVRVLRPGDEVYISENRAFLNSPEPLLVTKANTKSRVHRRIYMDCVSVKRFDEDGALVGELRIVGLFTSAAYTRSVLQIPYLRSKASAVIDRLGYDPSDHLGKALINVLEAYPRDELFQIGVGELARNADAILALDERPRVRALIRVDPFDRFVSVLVFVPKDRYTSEVRQRIGECLRLAFDGRVSAFYPAISDGVLARVHYIIGRNPGPIPPFDATEIERQIRAIVRNWDDALGEAAEASGAAPELIAIASGFPAAYRENFDARTALADAARLAALHAGDGMDLLFYRPEQARPHEIGLKIYHAGMPVALSRRVPVLENMGFRVISERTFSLTAEDGAPVFLHDMELESADGGPVDLDAGAGLFAEVMSSVWRGSADNDGYNGLARTAGMDSRRIGVLRAYGRYLQQAGIAQSPDFIAGVLNRHPRIASLLLALFSALLDPERRDEDEARRGADAITEALEAVPNIDEDAILRRFRNLIECTLRTNFFAARPVPLAFKFDSRRLEGLPDPRPWREIFVYGAEVEGVHLRFGPVARGGLRWSDRAQDYRTEVLGLVKAQQVKNALIVPVGAKGGFYPKNLPAGGDRDAVIAAGRSAYVAFVSALLSVTDNLEDGKTVPPAGVVRRDGDDPYLVVAADKGTATFSDTANAISAEHGFWLDDAFASGGSAGYDHKKMGITARGAWEAVKRHFRERDIDIQTTPFTVAGVGDMSGDVFGNGMLRSPCIRLVAAFDHRDIFLDPDPDPATSFAERKRLFDLPRSSWQDYDRSLLSPGGMIVSRNQKSIELSAEAAALLELAPGAHSPQEIIRAILRAPVDLLFFGGIGTYVRAHDESDGEVGDRANDLVRITGREIRARVVGEGANLGMTQRGRIEYALAGGRGNTDAIDNSAGVNSSDVEVNIKIALAEPMRRGRLSRAERNALLADMTDEVARLVLANNYRQPLAISLAERRGGEEMAHQGRLMQMLERRGLLDRQVEVLPDQAAFEARAKRGETLTRPEIAVLLAYAKLSLYDDLIAGTLPDDPWLTGDLVAYFPARMQEEYRDCIETHRLRREIIATGIANDAIDRGGPTFISRLQDLTGRTAEDIARAFIIVRDGFELPALIERIDALDNRIAGMAQLDLYAAVTRLIRSATAWYLGHGTGGALADEISALRAARAELEPQLARLLPAAMRAGLEQETRAFVEEGAPEELAGRLALIGISEVIPDIALVARGAGVPLQRAAEIYFAVTRRLGIDTLFEAGGRLSLADYYDAMAFSRAMETISAGRRAIAIAALGAHDIADDPVGAWLAGRGPEAERGERRLIDLVAAGGLGLSHLTVAAALIRDLAGDGR